MLHICKARGHEIPKISRGGNMDPQTDIRKNASEVRVSSQLSMARRQVIHTGPGLHQIC